MRNYPSETALSVREFGNVTVDVEARMVSVAGREVHLTRTEFDPFHAFIDHPRQALSRTELLSLVWGEGWFGDDHLVSVHIANLRRKLADGSGQPRLISTIHGYGYRFDGVQAPQHTGFDRVSALEAS